MQQTRQSREQVAFQASAIAKQPSRVSQPVALDATLLSKIGGGAPKTSWAPKTF